MQIKLEFSQFVDLLSERTGFVLREVLAGYESASFSEVHRYGKKIREGIGGIQQNFPNIRQYRLGLLGSSTQTYLASYLILEGLKEGQIVHTFVEEIGQFRQGIFNSESSLYRFNPDFVFWHLEPAGFLRQDEIASGQWDHENVLGEIQELASALLENSKCNLYLSDFHIPHVFPFFDVLSDAEQKMEMFNRGLKERFSVNGRVQVLDFNRLCAHVGHRNVTDPTLFKMGKVYYSHAFSYCLAKKIVMALLSFSRPRAKCIVLDLDNCLWGGLVGEDGVGSLHLGSEYPGYLYVEFQRQLLMLKRQGILLAVNSKNNYEDAMEAIRKHPNMILREKDFHVIRINWLEKTQNITDISEELGLGLFDFIFLDDSAVECEKMQRFLPEVLTVRLPDQPDDLPHVLPGISRLNTLFLSEEDKRRSDLYTEETKRKRLYHYATNMDDFLESLDIQMRIKTPEEREYQRIYQLILKTNQFNLTTIRYSLESLNGMIKSPDWFTPVIYVSDRFGDYGLVGMMLVDRSDKKEWRIETFLLSCRVLGRKIENSFCSFLLQYAGRNQADKVIGCYRATEKNRAFESFYPDMGFATGHDTGPERIYVADLGRINIPSSKFLKIVEEIAK
jgi:FkbH-like protein